MFMSISRQFVYRKDLLKLGMKNTHITPIVTQASVFKNVPKQKGYAVQFDFKQSVMIGVGCELFKLGMPFRHVDIVLTALSSVDIVPLREIPEEIPPDRKDEYIRVMGEEIAYLLITAAFPVLDMTRSNKKRTAPLFVEVYLRKENPLKDSITAEWNKDIPDSFVCIRLGKLIAKATWLFEGKL